MTPGLDIADLAVAFGAARVVDGVSLSVRQGSVLGLVGESGSGKSMIALACLGLVPRPGRISGTIRVAGRDIVGLSERDLRSLRGREIGIVFQDPMTSLNPVRRIGALMAETIRRRQARALPRGRAPQQRSATGKTGSQTRRQSAAVSAGLPQADRASTARP